MDAAFPYLVLTATNSGVIPAEHPHFRVMHQHENLQLIFVWEGSVRIKTLNAEFRVKSGEGLFLNQNVMHLIEPIGRCRYNSFLFPERFLEFYPGSPAKGLVEQALLGGAVPYARFRRDGDWGSEILELLKKLSQTSFSRLYAYEVLVRLSEIWLIMLQNLDFQVRREEDPAAFRMRKFLEYIEAHYAEPITLEQIAKSGEVGKTECQRCFKVIMDSTPYTYLMDVRLEKAAALLKNTKTPIGQIALAVGVQSLGSFGSYFKKKTGDTPRAYRKRWQTMG